MIIFVVYLHRYKSYINIQKFVIIYIYIYTPGSLHVFFHRHRFHRQEFRNMDLNHNGIIEVMSSSLMVTQRIGKICPKDWIIYHICIAYLSCRFYFAICSVMLEYLRTKLGHKNWAEMQVNVPAPWSIWDGRNYRKPWNFHMKTSRGSINGGTPIADWLRRESPNVTWMMKCGTASLGNLQISRGFL